MSECPDCGASELEQTVLGFCCMHADCPCRVEPLPGEVCPACNASLLGERLSEALQELYQDTLHFSRVITVYDRNTDRMVGMKCPDCEHEWGKEC